MSNTVLDAVPNAPGPSGQATRNQAADVSVAPSRPLLSEVVKMICDDARYDSLKYALRSNVGHDGE